MLSPEEIEELICQRLGVPSLPDAALALIRARGEGHPFFSEELAYALRDRGLLHIQDGVCMLASEETFAAVSLPATIEGVLTSHIDRLRPEHQLTLKVASVIGRIFLLPLLKDIHPIVWQRSQLEEHLETLVRLDFTLLEQLPSTMIYLFKHVITQEVVYNLMSFAQRQSLHRVVAEWYEQRYAQDLSPYYALLAHHWGRCGTVEREIHYLELAGNAAMREGSYSEARSFFEHALRLASPVTNTLRCGHWHRQLSTAYYYLGAYDKTKEHAVLALKLLGYPLPETTRGHIVRIAYAYTVQLLRLLMPDAIKQLQQHSMQRSQWSNAQEAIEVVERHGARQPRFRPPALILSSLATQPLPC